MPKTDSKETPDTHDFGKLTKWHNALESLCNDDFPVCALFLASGNDHRAHNIFRVYRTAFEESGAGFHNLVIFGQHGLSSTCSELIRGLGLFHIQMPSLVLITNNKDTNGIVFHTTALPTGVLTGEALEEDDSDIPWRAALDVIMHSYHAKKVNSLDDVLGLKRLECSDYSLLKILEAVKKRVEDMPLG